MPDTEPDRPSSANGLKRRRTESLEQESKRQRTSPGKIPPKAEETRKEKARDTPSEAEPSKPDHQHRDAPESLRRKSAITDEKQRSRRLFGSLLGNLNQPGDRTSKRRQEIEARRKAELQRQDDERLEDKQRRVEKLGAQRRTAQVKTDEDNMRTRHAQMLNAANFLQTKTEPKLYYRPWDLRADEEDRIDEQLRESQSQIDKELAVLKAHPSGENDTPPTKSVEPTVGSNTNGNEKEIGTAAAKLQATAVDQEAQAKSEDTNKHKSAEAPESPGDTNNASDDRAIGDGETKSADQVQQKPLDDEGDHIVEGEEDTVIY